MSINIWSGHGNLCNAFVENVDINYALSDRVKYHDIFLEYVESLDVTFLYEKDSFSFTRKESIIDHLIDKEKFEKNFIKLKNPHNVYFNPLQNRVFLGVVRNFVILSDIFDLEFDLEIFQKNSIRQYKISNSHFNMSEIFQINKKDVTNDFLDKIEEFGAHEIFKNVTTLREYIIKEELMKYWIRFKQTINSAISVNSNIKFNNIEELKEVLRREGIKYIVNGYYNFEDEYDTDDRTRTSVEDLNLAYALFSDILTRSYR